VSHNFAQEFSVLLSFTISDLFLMEDKAVWLHVTQARTLT